MSVGSYTNISTYWTCPNSLLWLQIDKCFGFESAVEEAQRALLAGYVEAASARCGLGLIKLMGRQSGYIAMQASMASGTPRDHPPPLSSLSPTS